MTEAKINVNYNAIHEDDIVDDRENNRTNNCDRGTICFVLGTTIFLAGMLSLLVYKYQQCEKEPTEQLRRECNRCVIL